MLIFLDTWIFRLFPMTHDKPQTELTNYYYYQDFLLVW